MDNRPGANDLVGRVLPQRVTDGRNLTAHERANDYVVGEDCASINEIERGDRPLLLIHSVFTWCEKYH